LDYSGVAQLSRRRASGTAERSEARPQLESARALAMKSVDRRMRRTSAQE
jgi:hypothetical protein